MNKLIVETSSPEETDLLGKKLGEMAEENMAFLMEGDLGAGKTALTRGIASGLGITRNVTSPTFTILKIYQGRMPLYHIDAYRLEGVSQDLGFEEYIYSGGLTVIEWAHFIPDILPETYLQIDIALLEDDRRRFTMSACGDRYEKLLEGWK